MKKLALLFTASLIFANCTNPKTETAAVEIATPTIKADSIYTENQKETLEKEESKQEPLALVSSGGNNPINNNSLESKPAKKKWSNKKKGAIIGASSGAVAGAVVSKKRVKGAVIGGAVGAGVGLGVGAILDKKEN